MYLKMKSFREDIRPKGKLMPLEQPIKFQGGGRKILNIVAHDPLPTSQG